MLAHAEEQLEIARTLLKNGTLQQYTAVVPVLEQLAGILDAWKENERKKGVGPLTAESHAFIAALPAQLSHLRHLLEAPLRFFAGREMAATAGFGSYERTGRLQPLASGKRFLAQL